MRERTPKEDLLVGGLDDWAYASWVANSVPASTSGPSSVLRHECVGLIVEVLVERLVVAGDVDDSGHHPWQMSVGDAIERIAREWVTDWPDELPTPGAIVWLANTPSGDERAHAVLAREAGRQES